MLWRLGVLAIGRLGTLGVVGVGAGPQDGIVDLEWRPAEQFANIEDTVEIGLYAVSGSGADEDITAIEAILAWDPSCLALLENADPCPDDPCPPNTYYWSSSGFPPDGAGLNADCSATEFCDPYSARPFNDGNALYWALQRLSPAPATATSEGLWVTTFRFRVLSYGVCELRFLARFGDAARTLVVSADSSGADITGTLGPPAKVIATEPCEPAAVTAAGPRYLSITPAPHTSTVALLVTGDEADPAVSCVSRYVQSDGRLDAAPVYRMPDEWQTVYVGDGSVIPSTTYSVQTACEDDPGSESLSAPVSVTTWLWGDVNNDGTVMFDDLTLVIDGSQGIFGGDTIIQNLDLAPCLPDGLIGGEDIAVAECALSGGSFSCLAPCAPGPTLSDFSDVVRCIAGPSAGVRVGCGVLDVDVDCDIDLRDFGTLQVAYPGP